MDAAADCDCGKLGRVGEVKPGKWDEQVIICAEESEGEICLQRLPGKDIQT